MAPIKRSGRVSTYISKFGRIKIARDSSHYDRATLEKVFEQNRINATFFQTSVIVSYFHFRLAGVITIG